MYEVHAAAFNFYYIHLLQGQSLWCFSWLCRGPVLLADPLGQYEPELFGMFSEVVFTWKEKAMCGSRLVLNSSNSRMTKWFRRRDMLSLQYGKVALWDEDQNRHVFEVLLLSGSVPFSQSPGFSERLLPARGMIALCALLGGLCAWE